jgi:hypothetical protein
MHKLRSKQTIGVVDMTVSRPSGLIHEVTELAQVLQRQESADVDTVLGELTRSAVSSNWSRD